MRAIKLSTEERVEVIKNELKTRLESMSPKVVKDGYYVPKKLLGTGSTKTIKGLKYGWTTYVLYMAPFRLNSKGLNLCPKATAGCVKACLFTSGRGSFQSVEVARFNKAEYFVLDRQKFMEQLVKEIKLIVGYHERMQVDETNKKTKNFAIRLNGTSDVDWELIKIDSEGGKNIFEVFPEVQFYDYTKIPSRMERAEKYPNYFVTFSLSEHNTKVAKKMLESGKSVASVYFPTIPESHLGQRVYDGDESDLIFTYQEIKKVDSLLIGLYLKVPKKTKLEIASFIDESLRSGFVNLVIDNKVVEPTEQNIKFLITQYLERKNSKVLEIA